MNIYYYLSIITICAVGLYLNVHNRTECEKNIENNFQCVNPTDRDICTENCIFYGKLDNNNSTLSKISYYNKFYYADYSLMYLNHFDTHYGHYTNHYRNNVVPIINIKYYWIKDITDTNYDDLQLCINQKNYNLVLDNDSLIGWNNTHNVVSPFNKIVYDEMSTNDAKYVYGTKNNNDIMVKYLGSKEYVISQIKNYHCRFYDFISLAIIGLIVGNVYFVVKLRAIK